MKGNVHIAFDKDGIIFRESMTIFGEKACWARLKEAKGFSRLDSHQDFIDGGWYVKPYTLVEGHPEHDEATRMGDEKA